MNILDEIVATKRIEIEDAKRVTSLETLKKHAFETEVVRRPFRALFEKGPALIAEVKPKSPSAGQIIGKYGHAVSIFEIAKLYAKSAADATSVLTDMKYFGGDLELLKSVRSIVPQAILRKEFIVDEYQIYETKAAGADAFLLIANILSEAELRDFVLLGKTLELDTLVEVHDEEDVRKSVGAGAELIGINNRDLKTLAIDIAVTENLIATIPSEIPVISESGIETVDDVRRVRAAGARGILVGTSILRSENPTAKIAELKSALS